MDVEVSPMYTLIKYVSENTKCVYVFILRYFSDLLHVNFALNIYFFFSVVKIMQKDNIKVQYFQ